MPNNTVATGALIAQLNKQVEAAYAMLYPGPESEQINHWLDQINSLLQEYSTYLGGLEEGLSSRKAWLETGTDAEIFTQDVVALEFPQILCEVLDEAEDCKEISDLSKEILNGYAKELDEHLITIQLGITQLMESASYF
jgi:hypothetical protein